MKKGVQLENLNNNNCFLRSNLRHKTTFLSIISFRRVMQLANITKDMLIGAWTLKDYYIEDEEGNRNYPLGKDCQGIIMYTPDGYMSAQMMTPNRKTFAIDNMHKGTDDEYAEAASGYHAYSGRFEFNETKLELRHYMDVSLFPNYVGQSQIRTAQLKDDHLYISNPKFGNQMIWKKLPINN